ncbi:MAG TPA: hypothetical protein VL137_07665, partial [Polyangiaceae bacterium]|nr:hypothetical protein [Polyangiaceae bacterium]
DCESGYFLLRGEWPVHRFFHTILGASLLCAATCLVFMPGLDRLRLRLLRTADAGLLRWLALCPASTWSVMLATAVTGVFGHVIPDGIMHSDIQPFAPFSIHNPLHELVSLAALHLLLVAAGALGFLLLILLKKPPSEPLAEPPHDSA